MFQVVNEECLKASDAPDDLWLVLTQAELKYAQIIVNTIMSTIIMSHHKKKYFKKWFRL